MNEVEKKIHEILKWAEYERDLPKTPEEVVRRYKEFLKRLKNKKKMTE